MNPIRHIRKHLLKVSQSGLADIAGTTQATVSRWETGELSPSLDEMNRIREAARAKSPKSWSDSLFFKAPAPEQGAAA